MRAQKHAVRMLNEEIYKLRPFAVAKPWGGGHLDTLVPPQAGSSIGEYVLFSDLPQFPVRVQTQRGDILVGDFLRAATWGESEARFMLKILSTAEPLSLQNHPSDADVAALGLRGNGKFECWTILDAAADARAYLGLKHGESRDVVSRLEAADNPLEYFNAYSLKLGDVVKLVPGLIHSTTGRLLFYEVQQQSDHTFRIYDFGRGRALHLKEALHSLRDQQAEIQNYETPLSTEKFTVLYHRLDTQATMRASGSAFSIFTWFGRAASVASAGKKIPLGWGDTFIARSGAELRCVNESKQFVAQSDREILPLIDMLFEAYA